MTANKHHFDVVLMCRVLCVSRSGYYDWRRRPPSARAQGNVALDAAITAVFTSQKGPRGFPGHHTGRTGERYYGGSPSCGPPHEKAAVTCQSSEEVQGDDDSHRAGFAREGTNSNHPLPVADNLLKQNFHAAAAHQKWVSHITDVPTDEGWLDVAVVMDL